jgi:DNA-binding CsgD family transcriptional regulator
MYEMDAISEGRQASAALPEHLTPRQLEVLALLCEGLPNKLIARRLDISSATVKIHVGHILRVLNVASRLQAVIAARSLGLTLDSGGVEPVRRNADIAPRYPGVLRLLLGDEGSQVPVDDSEWSLAAATG